MKKGLSRLVVRSKTLDIEETLKDNDFELKKTLRHGLPQQPSAVAMDQVQRIMAVGSRLGGIRIMGQSGIESYVEHEEEAEIQQLLFLVNEGALISVTDGSCLHMWTLRQKIPSVVQKLRFTREKVTCCCLPLQSQWLYVGTDAGNVRFVDIHRFSLSVYGVLWNQAISIQQREKPGAVVILSEQPTDTNKLLIGYQHGQLVLWDLKVRQAVFRLKHASTFSCVSWLSDGSKFVCGHLNGLLTVWSSKNPPALLETLAPSHDGKADETLSPITNIEWLSRTGRDPMLLYTGGMPRSHSLNQGCLTARHGKSTEMLMFDAPIVGLDCLCQQQYRDEVRDPLAALILLRNRVAVLDLTTPGFPEIENPLPINVHIPPVTCTAYHTGVDEDLLCDLWYLASKATQEKRTSHQKWPFRGGIQGEAGVSVTNDIIITGHLDSSVRLWDASSVTLFPLITVKVAHLFFVLLKPTGLIRGSRSHSGSPTTQQLATGSSSRRPPSPKERPVDRLPIQQTVLFPEDHMLVIVTDTSSTILCPFNKSQKVIQTKNLDLVIPRIHQEGRSPDTPISESPGSGQEEIEYSKDRTVLFPAGFQPSLLCHVKCESHNRPPQISTVEYSSSFGLLAIGTACSLSLVDVIQERCVWSYKSRDIPSLFDQHLQISTPLSSSLSPTSPVSASAGHESGRRNRRMRKNRSPTVPVAEMAALSEKRKKSGSVKLTKKAQSSGNLQETKLQLPEIRDQEATDSGKAEIQNEVETVYFNSVHLHKDALSSCLWIGLSMGCVVCMGLQIPSADKRLTDPVSRLSDGSVCQLKFPLILISSIKIQVSPSISPKPERKFSARHSSPAPATTLETTYMVLCTDHQIRVHDIPEHSSFKTDVVKGQYSYLKAKVITVNDQHCLVCLTSHGHIVIFSLPKVKVLFDVDSKLPVNEMRIWRTFAMGNHGEALYMGSGTEIQRISVLQNDGLNVPDSYGDLYAVSPFPERPEKGFFQRVFKGQPQSADRQQLFGKIESTRSSLVERVVPKVEASLANSPFSRAHDALIERQEKLSQLTDKSEDLAVSATEFAVAAREIRKRYEERSKKWWKVFL